MSKNAKSVKQVPVWWVVLLGLLVVGLTFAVAVLSKRPEVVASFEQCVNSGGKVSGANVATCEIGGVEFHKDANIEMTSADVKSFIGLSEEDALSKAHKNGVAARVLERDGQPLLMTMDFQEGRLNMTVKDGQVTKIAVEGQDLEILKP